MRSSRDVVVGVLLLAGLAMGCEGKKPEAEVAAPTPPASEPVPAPAPAEPAPPPEPAAAVAPTPAPAAEPEHKTVHKETAAEKAKVEEKHDEAVQKHRAM
jgi:outer membrane biosynthesis protein TonB